MVRNLELLLQYSHRTHPTIPPLQWKQRLQQQKQNSRLCINFTMRVRAMWRFWFCSDLQRAQAMVVLDGRLLEMSTTAQVREETGGSPGRLRPGDSEALEGVLFETEMDSAVSLGGGA